MVSVGWGYLSQGPAQPPGSAGSPLGFPIGRTRKALGIRAGVSLITGSEGKGSSNEGLGAGGGLPKPGHTPAAGVIVRVLETRGLGSTLCLSFLICRVPATRPSLAV